MGAYVHEDVRIGKGAYLISSFGFLYGTNSFSFPRQSVVTAAPAVILSAVTFLRLLRLANQTRKPN